jgi:acylphosphatase
MSTPDRIIRHVAVHGRVQGIGFRVWAERRALALGLEGWVRNRRDGSVEAVLAGSPAAVAAMIADLSRGPPLAKVDRVDERDADGLELAAKRPAEKFSLLPTV